MFPRKKFLDIIDKTFNRIRELNLTKGLEYTGDRQDDALANFRSNGKDVGIAPEVCLRVYAGKHWNSISQYIRDIQNGNERVYSESIEGRIDDLILYLLLLKAFVVEREEEKIRTTTSVRVDDLNWDKIPQAGTLKTIHK